MDQDRYPREYAHLVRDALVAALPWVRDCIAVNPEVGNFITELKIEIPPVHPEIDDPLVIETSHDPLGRWAPEIELYWSLWNIDLVQIETDPAVHLAATVGSLKGFLAEESAGYKAWSEGKLTCGGSVVPASEEPFPLCKADKIVVRSWRGTFDRELFGSWPGWPEDPNDPFYKTQ
ncbi:MAG: hypothetical protein JST40_05795 [Armatimonadetes bacterium]|nr:hypothetical protein [Armatimonadota bacterium]